MKKSMINALLFEKESFEEHYLWLEKHMPEEFFEEFTDNQVMTIVHNLMGFKVQGEFVQIHFNDCSIVICQDEPGADLKILQNYAYFGIQNYQTYISDSPLPGYKTKGKVRIAIIYYTKIIDEDSKGVSPFTQNELVEMYENIKTRLTEFSYATFSELLEKINSRYLRIITKDRLELTIEMFYRATTRDNLQYEVRLNKDWKKQAKAGPSARIVLAWRNTHKYKFLYKLASLIHRHNLVLKKVNAA